MRRSVPGPAVTMDETDSRVHPQPESATDQTDSVSDLAQRRYLGYEGSLLGPESDDEPAGTGLDDLPYPELGVADPLPGVVLRPSRGWSLQTSAP